MGALTVISDVGPAREIVAAPPYESAEARTGWLAEPSDAAALATAIEPRLGSAPPGAKPSAAGRGRRSRKRSRSIA